ncbi:MAG: helix-turn-helix domain-containing protein, partial [Candidatus Bathyarchaeia archaeon]
EIVEIRKNRRGEESDEILLETIKQFPGLSQYELGKKLGWKTGRVDGSIRRLLNEGKIVIKVLERNGRRVNLVYPKEEKPRGVIEVSAELLEAANLLQAANPAWNEYAYVYALDSSTIGISGSEMPEWKEISCFLEKTPIQKADNKILLKIPERFWRFYNMERKHSVVSINGNNILITVAGNIIEEKRYPA